jgi:hypothetical protein
MTPLAPRIVNARHVRDHVVDLRFETGESGQVDLHAIVHRYSAAAPLRDPAVFAGFALDDWPTLTWPCGFDVSPETLYSLATGRPVAWEHEPAAAQTP